MVGRKVRRVGVRKPTFGIAVVTPVLLIGAVAASPDTALPTDAHPSAAVNVADAPSPQPPPPAAAPESIPEPIAAAMRIPAEALSAYRKAARIMAADAPDCGLSWNLLAGIGRIDPSASNGGLRSIYARPMDPNAVRSATWPRFASDGDGDGKFDPRNPFDAALATARHLCSSGLNLADQAQALAALLRYNDSVAFAQNVLGWASAYATGSAPLDLPRITGPVPTLGRRLPGRTWRDLQAPGANSTQAGYLLPRPAAVVDHEQPPVQSPPPPPVEPEPAPVVPMPAPPVEPPRTVATPTGRAAAVPPAALQRDRKPSTPVASANGGVGPSGAGGGRQSARSQAGSQPPPSAQSPGNNDGGGAKRAGGERRGAKSGR